MTPSERQPQPRCPQCRWFLRFAPYPVVYPRNDLALWAGYCWNPSCRFAEHGSTSGLRVVGPEAAVFA